MTNTLELVIGGGRVGKGGTLQAAKKLGGVSEQENLVG